jgi:acyl-CoA thioester hydrolase
MMPKPIIHTFTVKVKPEDLDELNHVNNVVYIAYLQEAAISHWYSSVPQDVSDKIRWVVRKHEVEYLKPAKENDDLIIHTWISKFNGISSERHYEIRRGHELLVKAFTLWIALDSETMKPKRLSSGFSEYFFESSVL